jgi:uncharacterized protein YbbC (DUF1343 family)
MRFAFSRRLFLQKLSYVLIAVFFFSIPGGMLTSASTTGTAASSIPSRPNSKKILLGIDVLSQNQFQPLSGKRVGLLTHPAGINRNGVSTIEVLRLSPRVNLVALFGPEHGIYGNEKASVPIKNRIDSRTGLPIYSLYGKSRKPIPAMLEGLDVLVIDLQDLGVRSYTFISCMRLAIEACFENNVEVMVLDRPNPIGGLKVDGPPMEKRWMSYVGAYRIPYVHGLTIGELATMATQLSGWLEVDDITRKKGELTVISMEGWRRSFLWADTGLQWRPTSPAIKDLSAALGYAMIGLGCELSQFSHGYGSQYLFRVIRYPGKNPEQIQSILAAKKIPGLTFKIIEVPMKNKDNGRAVYALVSDWEALRPTEVSFHMMQIACSWSRTNPFTQASSDSAKLFNKHVGSTEWWNVITTQGARVNVNAFIDKWEKQAQIFQDTSRKFWLYN